MIPYWLKEVYGHCSIYRLQTNLGLIKTFWKFLSWNVKTLYELREKEIANIDPESQVNAHIKTGTVETQILDTWVLESS